MSKIGRNDDCPCGSGSKYKNCHLGKPFETDGGGEILAPVDDGTRRAKAAIPALVLTLVLGTLGAFFKGGEGLLVGASVGFIMGIGWTLMNNPPPPTDNNQGSSINFGG